MKTRNILLHFVAALILSANLSTVSRARTVSPRAFEPEKIVVSSAQALELLAQYSGKTVVWVGAPSTQSVAIARTSRTLAEVIGELSDEWEVAVMITPDAVFLHAPKTFDHIRPAHFDPLLPQVNSVELLNRLPRRVLARFPLGLTEVPPSHVPKSLAEALPLALLEKEAPGFERELRELLTRADARLSGEQQINGETITYKARLGEVPTEQLYIRLYAVEQVWCEVGKDHAGLFFPVSLSTYAANNPLFISARPLVETLTARKPTFAADAATETVNSTVGELIRSKRFTGDNRKEVPVVVDKRAEAIPVTIVLSREGQPPGWSVLEAGLGIERRDLGEILFFAAWLDKNSHAGFSFISRWARATDDLWTTLFTPYAIKLRDVTARELGWRQLSTLLAELRRRRARRERSRRA